MNQVILIGRLTKDPKITYTQDAEPMAIARFTLAVDRRTKAKEADFINCVAFRRSAEFAEKFLRQGTKIALSGNIRTGSYTNREGVKVYTTEVVADSMEFAEAKQAEPKPADEFMPVPDELGLPFH